MEQHFLALDFGSSQITAVLVSYDEHTGTCRVRKSLREKCPSVSACYILDFDRTVRALNRIFERANEYITYSPTVIVGLRGNFLSFHRSGGFLPITSRHQIITDKDVQLALDNSIPESLNPELEVVDLLAQGYTVDGKTGVQNPIGLAASCLETETFFSCALKTHLANLQRALAAAGCDDVEMIPTILALCSTLLKEEEKRAGVLLLDIGAQNSSVALYHKGMLEGALEIPKGADLITQEVADVLQNDFDGTKKILADYTYGEDEILDDVLDEAAQKLLKTLKKELQQTLFFVKYPPAHIVLTGGGADLSVKNAAQTIFGARRTRIASHDGLISDSEEMLSSAYTSGISLALHSQRHGGRVLQNELNLKNFGFFNRMLAKLGLN